VTITDVDGDGLDDLVFTGSSPGAHQVYRHLGALAFERRALASATSASKVIGADFGAGGGTSLLLLGEHDPYLLVQQGNRFGAPVALGTGRATTAAAADFDGDGTPDLALGLTAAGGSVAGTGVAGAVYRSTMSAAEPFAPSSELTRIPARAMLATDVDLDATQDIIALGANGVHRVFTNDGAAGFSLSPHLFATDGASTAGFAATLGRFTIED